jgi:hypothetical protein
MIMITTTTTTTTTTNLNEYSMIYLLPRARTGAERALHWRRYGGEGGGRQEASA